MCALLAYHAIVIGFRFIDDRVFLHRYHIVVVVVPLVEEIIESSLLFTAG